MKEKNDNEDLKNFCNKLLAQEKGVGSVLGDERLNSLRTNGNLVTLVDTDLY